MTVVAYVDGVLEPRELDHDFMAVINMLNQTSQEGKDWLVARKIDGKPIGLYIHSTVIIEEE